MTKSTDFLDQDSLSSIWALGAFRARVETLGEVAERRGTALPL